MRLLVVDWDSFFLDRAGKPGDKQWPLYDWGHREAPFWIDGPIWTARAGAFLANNLPLPGLSGGERTFWRRFSFVHDAPLYTADSNAYAAHPDVQEGVTEVWLYDAHHDAGYHVRPEITGRTLAARLRAYGKQGRWGCDDWMILYHLTGADLHVRYPAWKTWAFDNEAEAILPDFLLDRQLDAAANEPHVTFDKVLACRSGAWVPPWHDRAWARFIRNAPRDLRLHTLDDCLAPRAFRMAEAETQAAQLRATHARMAATDRALTGYTAP